MTAADTHPDPETLYRLAYTQHWAEGLDVLHRHHAEVAGDPLLRRAADVLLDAFFAGPDARAGAELEKLFLLHSGGLFVLPAARFEEVVVRLVALHEDRPEAAAGYARFCPDHPRCAAVLARHGPAGQARVTHAQAETTELFEGAPGEEDLRLSLFKSQQEREFFKAARAVFARHLVYPNVPLRSLVDYDRLKDRLTSRERRFVFTALVDCVVFDPADDYRPHLCFELDSPLHDDLHRQENDARKDRLLALAGLQLYRVRPRGEVDFKALLEEIVGPFPV